MTITTPHVRPALAGLAAMAVFGSITATVATPMAGAATAPPASATTSTSAVPTARMQVKADVTLNVRAGAGTTYAVVGRVTGGAVLTGQRQSTGWFLITTGTFAGRYVSGAYLVAVPVTPTTTTPPSTTSDAFTGYVSKTLIKTLAHATPSTTGTVVRSIAPGAPISGVIMGDWLRTTRGDYVSRALITPKPLANGNMPASRLCDVPLAWNSPGSWAPGYTPKTVRKIDCFALKSLAGLQGAYKARFGRYARIDLAYRPLSEQHYWFDKFGYPRAAIPGTSNHGLGVAVDFRETDVPGEEFGWGGSGYTWLKQNGARWGFRNTFAYGTVGESYHWDFEGVN